MRFYNAFIKHVPNKEMGSCVVQWPITTQYRILTYVKYIAVENIVGKGEIACNKQFLLFLTMFSTLYGTYFQF